MRIISHIGVICEYSSNPEAVTETHISHQHQSLGANITII